MGLGERGPVVVRVGRYPARVLLGDSVTVTVVVIGCVLVLVAAVIGIVRLARGKKE